MSSGTSIYCFGLIRTALISLCAFALSLGVSLLHAEPPLAGPSLIKGFPVRPIEGPSVRVVAWPRHRLPAFGTTRSDRAFTALRKTLERSQSTTEVESEIDNFVRIIRRSGYLGAPSLSSHLLGRAEEELLSGRIETARTLTKRAVELSPRSGRVYLEAAFASSQFSWLEPLEYLLRGLPYYRLYPGLLYSAGYNATILFLISVTCALTLLSAVQIVAHAESLILGFGRSFPLAVRGWLAPLCLLLIVVLPMFAGLLAALLIWNLVLMVLLPRRSFVFTLVVLLGVAWGLVIPVLVSLGPVLNSSSVAWMEAINNGDYIRSGESKLLVVRGDARNDLGFAILLSRELIAAEQFASSAALLDDALAANLNSPLAPRALTNLAVSYYYSGDAERARNLVEEAIMLGGSFFALYYNAAQLAMDNADPAAFRKYLHLANSIDPQRVDTLEPVTGRLPLLVSVGLDARSISGRVLGAGEYGGVQLLVVQEALSYRISKPLFFIGAPQGIIFASLICLVAGVLLRLRVEQGARVRQASALGEAKSRLGIFFLRPLARRVSIPTLLSVIFISMCIIFVFAKDWLFVPLVRAQLLLNPVVGSILVLTLFGSWFALVLLFYSIRNGEGQYD